MTRSQDAETDGTGLAGVIDNIERLRGSVLDADSRWASRIADMPSDRRASARNLAHYWAVRQLDLRGLQQQLAELGLSTLGCNEPRVRAMLEEFAPAVPALGGRASGSWPMVGGFEDAAIARRNAVTLLGPEPRGRQTRIMVTLPSEAAMESALVSALVEHGMDLALINCAHDSPRAWAEMVRHVRQASAATGRQVRIAMELAGPQLRTGPMADGPQVVKLRPSRDELGQVTAPARCWIGPADDQAQQHARLPILPVPSRWVAGLHMSDTITFRDARGARRRFVIEAQTGRGVVVSTAKTSYVATGTVLESADGDRAAVGRLPPTRQCLRLRRGDTVRLTRDCVPGEVSGDGPPSIGCTLPEAFAHVAVGHRVHFDHGRLGGTVIVANQDQITVQITSAAAAGSRLRADERITLPDTVLPVSAITAADRVNLPFITEHADIVTLPFARTPQDVDALLDELAKQDDEDVGVVVRIESAQACANLPEILLAAMRRPNAGVMVAQEDLVVECSYQRLVEVQEEIIRLCPAAHLPVIWTNRDLDQLINSGQPSRAATVDQQMEEPAACVLLDKDLDVLDGIAVLDEALCKVNANHHRAKPLIGSGAPSLP